MNFPIRFGYLNLILVILPLLAACDKGDETGTDSVKNEKPELEIGSTWIYNEILGDEVDIITGKLIGEEVVNGDLSYMIDFQYDAPMYRIGKKGADNIRLLGLKFWYSKTTMHLNRTEINYRSPAGIKLSERNDYSNIGYDHQQFWVGQSWSYDTFKEWLIPGLWPVLGWEANVVAIEKITVPAGTFQCFKVEHTIIAGSGQEITPVRTVRTEWLAPEECFIVPVKLKIEEPFYESFIWELVSYSQFIESSG